MKSSQWLFKVIVVTAFMILFFFPTATWVLGIVATAFMTLVFFPQAAEVLGAWETVFLVDGFDTPFLNTPLWLFDTNSLQAGYTVKDGQLKIDSGTQNGAGAWVQSKPAFTPGAEILVFEARIRVSADDGGAWGFIGDSTGAGMATFGVAPNKVLGVAVSTSRGDPAASRRVDIFNVDVTAWHDYRIEIAGGMARFYIDGDLVARLSEKVPQHKPMPVRLNQISRGVHQILSVDYVKVATTRI